MIPEQLDHDWILSGDGTGRSLHENYGKYAGMVHRGPAEVFTAASDLDRQRLDAQYAERGDDTAMGRMARFGRWADSVNSTFSGRAWPPREDSKNQTRAEGVGPVLVEWAYGRGAVGEWAAAEQQLKQAVADKAGRTVIKQAYARAKELRQAAETEYGEVRDQLQQWSEQTRAVIDAAPPTRSAVVVEPLRMPVTLT